MFDFTGPVGFTIFCDDIRDELGGKTSVIGIYSGAMLIHAPFPVALPKFGFYIEILEPARLLLERDFPIEFSVYLPGDEEGKPSLLMQLPADPAAAKETYDNLPWRPTRPLLAHTTLKWIVSPLQLKGPGAIRVLAGYKDDQIRCGGLQVISAPTVTQGANHTGSC
jgi:hypothetical protein